MCTSRPTRLCTLRAIVSFTRIVLCSSTLASAVPALGQQFADKRAPYRVFVDGITGHIWQLVLRFLRCGEMCPLNKLEALAVMAAADTLGVERMRVAAKACNTDGDGVGAVGLVAKRCHELRWDHSQGPRWNRRTRRLNLNNSATAMDISPSSSSSSPSKSAYSSSASSTSLSSSLSDSNTYDASSGASPDPIKSVLSKVVSCNKDRLQQLKSSLDEVDEVDEVLDVINQATRNNHRHESTIGDGTLHASVTPAACKSDSTLTNICECRIFQRQMRCRANEDCHTNAKKMRLRQKRDCAQGRPSVTAKSALQIRSPWKVGSRKSVIQASGIMLSPVRKYGTSSSRTPRHRRTIPDDTDLSRD